MKKIMGFVLSSFLMISLSVHADNSPVGFWQTIDDVSGQPKAIVQITQNDDQTLSGKILKIYPRPGHDQHELCTACEGDKHNQPIVGMRILDHLKQSKKNAKSWTDGKILDPNNGKTYHCNVLLADNNQKLQVRGYIGVPLFGRSQTWNRVESES